MLRSFIFVVAVGLSLGLALPESAAADPIRIAQSSGMTLEQAIRQVQRQYGGRIVSATTEVRNGREVHVIRILAANGNVRTVRVPGRSRGNR